MCEKVLTMWKMWLSLVFLIPICFRQNDAELLSPIANPILLIHQPPLESSENPHVEIEAHIEIAEIIGYEIQFVEVAAGAFDPDYSEQDEAGSKPDSDSHPSIAKDEDNEGKEKSKECRCKSEEQEPVDSASADRPIVFPPEDLDASNAESDSVDVLDRIIDLPEISVVETSEPFPTVILDLTPNESAEQLHSSLLKVMCTHTDEQYRPWWQVDLGHAKLIGAVNIYNRGEGFNAQLHDVYIGVGQFGLSNDPILAQFPATQMTTQCERLENSLPPGLTHIECSAPVKGRFVVIQIDSNDTSSLTLCEVEVFGMKHEKIDTITNLAEGKPAIQSSTSRGGKPENAVDGSVTTLYYQGNERLSCLQSKDPWENYEEAFFEGKTYENCQQLYTAGHRTSGAYIIELSPDGNRKLFSVICDMEEDGGGWTVIMDRHQYLAIQEDFMNKTDLDYLNGFGQICSEHWIGVENLHLLTKENNMLRIEIDNSYDADFYYETFYEFQVDGPDSNYSIHVGDYRKLSDMTPYGSTDCLISGTQYSVQPERGGWWWLPSQIHDPTYAGPNGQLWKGDNVEHPIQWCNYINEHSQSRPNFYIQFLQLKIRPSKQLHFSLTLDGPHPEPLINSIIH